MEKNLEIEFEKSDRSGKIKIELDCILCFEMMNKNGILAKILLVNN